MNPVSAPAACSSSACRFPALGASAPVEEAAGLCSPCAVLAARALAPEAAHGLLSRLAEDARDAVVAGAPAWLQAAHARGAWGVVPGAVLRPVRS